MHIKCLAVFLLVEIVRPLLVEAVLRYGNPGLAPGEHTMPTKQVSCWLQGQRRKPRQRVSALLPGTQPKLRLKKRRLNGHRAKWLDDERLAPNRVRDIERDHYLAPNMKDLPCCLSAAPLWGCGIPVQLCWVRR